VTDQRSQSAQERAEELVARATADASRFLTRLAGRVREEMEDIVAEARARTEHGSERDED
jgi:DNA-directed RNA polymerase specialized sigma24 family protein